MLALALGASPYDGIEHLSGFSSDGKQFVWVAKSPMLSDIRYFKTIALGQAQPSQKTIEADDKSIASAKKKLQAFKAPRAPPAELKLDAQLTATPPKLALVRGGKRIEVPIGAYPYPPSDFAEIAGVCANGKYAAVHIQGRDVPGLFSTGAGGEYHFYFVAPVP